jgi:hypothetical protein
MLMTTVIVVVLCKLFLHIGLFRPEICKLYLQPSIAMCCLGDVFIYIIHLNQLVIFIGMISALI